MLQCISFNSTSIASSPGVANHYSCPSPSLGNSVWDAAGTSVEPSPNREYISSVQTNSFVEMMSKIHPSYEDQTEVQYEYENEEARIQLLEHVLYPKRESIKEALYNARPNALTRIVSDYFEHSESTSNLCLLLRQSIYRARSLYAPVITLLEVLPDDSQSLSQSQCNSAFDLFLQFDHFENPFPCPESQNFNEMRRCFFQLKQQLDQRLRKWHSRVRLVQRGSSGSALYLIGNAAVVAVSTFAMAVNDLAARVVSPCLPANCPPVHAKKSRAHVAQLHAAAKGTYVLNNDLDTIDRLVARLHAAVESDKLLVSLGLERGKDRHAIQEVVKQLRRNHSNFMNQLNDLEEHLCLCFSTVNKARSLLYDEICLHQTGNL